LEFCGIVVRSFKVDNRDGMHIHIHLDRGILVPGGMGVCPINQLIDAREF
jgi:hypothetical protein